MNQDQLYFWEHCGSHWPQLGQEEVCFEEALGSIQCHFHPTNEKHQLQEFQQREIPLTLADPFSAYLLASPGIERIFQSPLDVLLTEEIFDDLEEKLIWTSSSFSAGQQIVVAQPQVVSGELVTSREPYFELEMKKDFLNWKSLRRRKKKKMILIGSSLEPLEV